MQRTALAMPHAQADGMSTVQTNIAQRDGSLAHLTAQFE